ncbi:MAG: hypothetical protein ABW032_05190 [Burkholderiaceae bacterium]
MYTESSTSAATAPVESFAQQAPVAQAHLGRSPNTLATHGELETMSYHLRRSALDRPLGSSVLHRMGRGNIGRNEAHERAPHGSCDVQSARIDSRGEAFWRGQVQQAISNGFGESADSQPLDKAYANLAGVEMAGGGTGYALTSVTTLMTPLQPGEQAHHMQIAAEPAIARGPRRYANLAFLSPERNFSLLRTSANEVKPEEDVVVDVLSDHSALAVADSKFDLDVAKTMYSTGPTYFFERESEVRASEYKDLANESHDIPAMLAQARQTQPSGGPEPFAVPPSAMHPQFAIESRTKIEGLSDADRDERAIRSVIAVKPGLTDEQAAQIKADVLAMATDRTVE